MQFDLLKQTASKFEWCDYAKFCNYWFFRYFYL